MPQVLRDPHLRVLHDRELLLQDMRSTMMYQDELEVEEMDQDEHEGEWRTNEAARNGGRMSALLQPTCQALELGMDGQRLANTIQLD